MHMHSAITQSLFGQELYLQNIVLTSCDVLSSCPTYCSLITLSSDSIFNFMLPILIPATSSPTTSETTALAALVPEATAPSKSAAAVLDEVLALCQNPDVTSFLFTDDKIQLPYLTSPYLFTSAITGTMTSTRVEPDLSRASKIGPSSDFGTGKWVFVPAFSVSGVSLGFGMHDLSFNQGDAWGTDLMMYVRAEFRFVANEAKNELLILFDIPDMNICSMEYSRNVTPTCQTRTSLCLSRDKLHEVAKSGYLDRTSISASLGQISTIYEYRNCLTCHRDHTACRCTLQIARTRHPLDHMNFAKNMTQRLGTFEGVANVFCYDAGRFTRKTALGSRSSLHGGVDHELITLMRDWAVGLHLKGTENPLQTIVIPGQCKDPEDAASGVDRPDDVDLSLEHYMASGSLWLDDNIPLDTLPPLGALEDDLLGLPAAIEATMMEAFNLPFPEGQRRGADVMTERLNGRPAEGRKNVQPLLDLTGKAAASSLRSSNRFLSNAVDVDQTKNLKTEMRRRRNRESAQRSNMKKKAMNDKLKHQLKTNKEKAATLRIQESALRQENIRLRRLLSESP